MLIMSEFTLPYSNTNTNIALSGSLELLAESFSKIKNDIKNNQFNIPNTNSMSSENNINDIPNDAGNVQPLIPLDSILTPEPVKTPEIEKEAIPESVKTPELIQESIKTLEPIQESVKTIKETVEESIQESVKTIKETVEEPIPEQPTIKHIEILITNNNSFLLVNKNGSLTLIHDLKYNMEEGFGVTIGSNKFTVVENFATNIPQILQKKNITLPTGTGVFMDNGIPVHLAAPVDVELPVNCNIRLFSTTKLQDSPIKYTLVEDTDACF